MDIGGTTIAVGLVDSSGTLQAQVQAEPLGDNHDPAAVAQRIARLADAALAAAAPPAVLTNVLGVGVCTPGLVDIRRGVVNSAANLKGWSQVPICDLCAAALAMPRHTVVLENDTNAALLAEVWTGAAVGHEHAVLMTLGTGVGGAILCDGRLLRGSRGQAGEIGHSILVPDGRKFGKAGVDGIFEGYASASSVAIRVTEKGGPPEGSSLRDATKPIDCAAVFKHAQQGDEFAMEIVRETARCLALGCVNVCRTVDPDIIIFAGGMAEAGEFLLQEVSEQFSRYHWNIEPLRVDIVKAAAGAHSGVIGAARAAFMCLNKESA